MTTLKILFISIILLPLPSFSANNDETSTEESEPRLVSFTTRSEPLTRRIKQALLAKGTDYQPRTEHLLADGSPKYTNRLILEDSPYLIQHAHNPMDWYPWGEEAFEAAKREDKPIFLSIGYSTCHWCHVMERESFENLLIARTINQYFIPVKVDRERRPDVDTTYMHAVTLISGSGGWPMSSFLTAEGKPFYAGTYFPPETFHKLLLNVTSAWSNHRGQLIAQGNQVALAVAKITSQQAQSAQLSQQAIENAIITALGNHDNRQGGFGQAPKFPQEPLLFLLLQEVERNDNKDALAALQLTLDSMARGGIYDQVGGGFHRYSTDNVWLVPHFEKMLYNQAHLARVYLLAWRLTGDSFYRRIATQTLDYVLRDMLSADGAFYSATDADSEGEEGTFFLWTPEQIREVLTQQDAQLAIEVFGIDEEGNFEHRNIPNLPVAFREIAAQKGMTLDQFYSHIDRIREQLYQIRRNRIHPLRDEKIITAWNGMMISTLAQAGDIFGERRYTQAAMTAAQFIWDHNRQDTGKLWRVHLDGSSSIAAQQEDYAYFAEGLLHLYDVTGEQHWLDKAKEITNTMLLHFWNVQAGGFYMSEEGDQLTAMGRAKDGGTDNAIPSGNSVALRVLQMLDARSDNLQYGKKANATLAAFASTINRHPTNFGYMLTGANDLRNGELGAQRYLARGGVRAKAQQLETGQVVVELTIPPGWHINSNRPFQKELIATSVDLSDANTGWQLRDVTYPPPVTATLGFQRESLSLYTGQVQIRMEVTSDVKPSRILPLQLSIQACNDRICLPPEKVALSLPMTQ